MKKEVWLGQNSARFIYFRYKDSPYFSWLILSIIFLVCFLLVFLIIIPQAQSWFSIRNEELATRKRIATLKNNIAFMSMLNKNVVEGHRQLAIRALPVDKDFAGIINAVVIAAVQSGVSVDDFSFNLGLVTSGSANLKNVSAARDFNTKLSLSLTGDIGKIKNFITNIGEKLPLSEVETVEVSNDFTNISLFFYSEPYKAPRVSGDESIRALTAENNILYGKLLKWDMASSSYENQQNQSPSSDVPLF